ncbi:MAG TPA: 2,3-epoxybenzoyl-CoA dihydrolase [Acidimicrobiia bacterium]|jgi:benzoyl-CoA-dihydrodiol lyase|nr:2,3-epoxybenzoyl-CoA dihydrolase [Acidimicrobiia bacterium]
MVNNEGDSIVSNERNERPVTFDRHPSTYRHWSLEIEPPLARLTMQVDPDGGLNDGYQLKLNSYDLGVDIELNDAVQRLRFEHPEVRAVIVSGGLDKMFCAGANIQMLAGASHHHKVNFCKFTNETRNSIEDATGGSQQAWLAAVNGTAAGGGYELALACDDILLVDDRSSAVSLPEVPLLGVLPGTGGLTRVVDKRHVRRDLADVFATRTEGVRGTQAVEWGLVDAIAPRTKFDEEAKNRALARAEGSDRPADATGVELTPLERTVDGDVIRYPTVEIRVDRELGTAWFTLTGPSAKAVPGTPDAIVEAGTGFWALAACRELDDAILHLRFNEPEIGTWVLQTKGDIAAALAVDDVLREHADHWLVREIRLYWRRTLKRLDLSARTLVTLVTPGSCFAGTLAELVLAADRSFMLEGTFEDAEDDLPPAELVLTDANDGWYTMSNGLTRLHSRFYGHDDAVEAVRASLGKHLLAEEASVLGLVTFTPDDIDWEDEIRLCLEERASFSPDALTGLEANYRFVGPETIETKIFGRLTAWQNWIFQRPNASGPDGALRRYGTGSRPSYDRKRV